MRFVNWNFHEEPRAREEDGGGGLLCTHGGKCHSRAAETAGIFMCLESGEVGKRAALGYGFF